jgi:hypothetical protein
MPRLKQLGPDCRDDLVRAEHDLADPGSGSRQHHDHLRRAGLAGRPSRDRAAVAEGNHRLHQFASPVSSPPGNGRRPAERSQASHLPGEAHAATNSIDVPRMALAECRRAPGCGPRPRWIPRSGQRAVRRVGDDAQPAREGQRTRSPPGYVRCALARRLPERALIRGQAGPEGRCGSA